MFLRIIFVLIILFSFISCTKKEEIYSASKIIDPYKSYIAGFEAFEKNEFFFAHKKFSEAELNFKEVEFAAKSSIMSSFSLYGINFYSQSEENFSQTNNQSDFDLVDSNCRENKKPPSAEPPPPPPPKRRLTISSPQGISERIPQKKYSLEDQLRSALASKFSVPVDGKNDNYDSDDSSSNWT